MSFTVPMPPVVHTVTVCSNLFLAMSSLCLFLGIAAFAAPTTLTVGGAVSLSNVVLLLLLFYVVHMNNMDINIDKGFFLWTIYG